MVKLSSKKSKKTRLFPSAITEKKAEKVKITIMDYNETRFQEKEVKKIEECFPFKDKPTITWINIDSIQDIPIIEQIGAHFDMHPLIIEDIVNTTQRPKYEDFGDYILIVLKMLYYDEKEEVINAEQISLIIGSNFVISFQEKEGDIFDPIRDRIRNDKGRIRKMGADYLAYALIDAIVDHYFTILEKIGEKIETKEEELVSNPRPEILQAIHELKREMIFLRRSVWPLREVVSGLQRTESSLIAKSTGIFLRDVYDHTIQVIDTIETFRDMTSSMLDIYLSSLSNKMNEVMKVLTIIATIFIPLTFIAGVYGMNFKYMPELTWHLGYAVVWLIMISVAILMVCYFKKKEWL